MGREQQVSESSLMLLAESEEVSVSSRASLLNSKRSLAQRSGPRVWRPAVVPPARLSDHCSAEASALERDAVSSALADELRTESPALVLEQLSGAVSKPAAKPV